MPGQRLRPYSLLRTGPTEVPVVQPWGTVSSRAGSPSPPQPGLPCSPTVRPATSRMKPQGLLVCGNPGVFFPSQ